MKQILNVGMNPHTVDLTTPEFPPGLTVEKVLQGIEFGKQKLSESGISCYLKNWLMLFMNMHPMQK